MQIGMMPIAMPISNGHEAWTAHPSEGKVGLSGQCCVATLNVGKNADRNETEKK
jgi:hypothetical protein